MKNLFRLLIFVVVATAVAVAALAANADKDSVAYALGSGIIASLIAAVVYSAASYFLLKESSDEKEELQKLISEFRARQLSGVIHICHKFEQKPDYWNNFLALATDRLDLMGHAFTTWTHEPHKEAFAQAMQRVLRAGGRVRIVLLDPTSDNTARLSMRVGRQYVLRLEETLRFFEEVVYPSLRPKDRGRLTLVHEAKADMPYMYLDNGKTVIVSPYWSKTSDNKDNMTIEVERDSKFGIAFRADFDQSFVAAAD